LFDIQPSRLLRKTCEFSMGNMLSKGAVNGIRAGLSERERGGRDMCRAMLLTVRIIAIAVLVLLSTVMAHAGDSDNTKPKALIDCRYEQSDGESSSEAFPSDDVFRPLLADPKQPQFFALWQVTQARADKTSANMGSVGFGENFGFYTRRQGCNGWQIGLLTGVFAQFNLDAKTAELVNTDFVVGVPLTWRAGNWSGRLRYNHQSSHLGDEFLAARPGFQISSFTFEEVEAIGSYDYRWLRLYVGYGVLVHREPSWIDRNRVQWGFEARGPSMRSAVLGVFSTPISFTPLLTGDFKSVEEQDWLINTNVLGGVDMSRAGSQRRLRILVNFYHGFNPYGQFVSQKVQSVGVGAYFLF